MTFALDIAPRFDYGRESHETHVTEDGVVFRGAKNALSLNIVREPEMPALCMVSKWTPKGDLHIEITLTAGQSRGIVMETGEPRSVRQIRVSEVWQLLEETARYWRSWLAQSTYTGRWRETLQRSVITLKLMTYAPSGGSSRRQRRRCPSRSAGSATGTTGTPGFVTPRSRSMHCSVLDSLRRRQR